MRFLKAGLGLAALLAALVVVLRLIFPLPDEKHAVPSAAIPPSEDTRLGAALLPVAAEHPGKSAVLALAEGRGAFAARVLLIRAAEVSLDVQYYIWQTDTTGWILLDELRKAAGRGVRVRLLLDDNGIPGLDPVLAALDGLENVEVRLYNPFTLRSPKSAAYLFDFPRLNRRMHNKSITADGIASVVGGRNVGDIYFSYGDGVHYFDLDVLVGGPGAGEVSRNFDRFWDSAPVWPAAQFLPPAPEALDDLAETAARARETALGTDFAGAVRDSPVVRSILSGADALEWTEVTIVSDDPGKGSGEVSREDLLMTRVAALLKTPERSVDLVSAYFIPGVRGTQVLTGLADSGVAVRVLTNSFEATDVLPVHAAYQGYRGDLIAGGVEMLELRANPRDVRALDLGAILTGSASSLHAKTLGIDGERIFIGSFNFDPRSVRLNTEMGLLIESPAITGNLASALDDHGAFFKVESRGGDLVWIETGEDGAETVHAGEPGMTWASGLAMTLIGWLPVEWLL